MIFHSPGSNNMGRFIPDLTYTLALAQGQTCLWTCRSWLGLLGNLTKGELGPVWKFKSRLHLLGLQPRGFTSFCPLVKGWLSGYNVTAGWICFYFSNEQSFWGIKIKLGTRWGIFKKNETFFFWEKAFKLSFLVKYFLWEHKCVLTKEQVNWLG